jgi:hypothetical protein
MVQACMISRNILRRIISRMAEVSSIKILSRGNLKMLQGKRKAGFINNNIHAGTYRHSR